MSVKLSDLVDFITVKENPGVKFNSPEYINHAKDIHDTLCSTMWLGGVHVCIDFDDPEYIKESLSNDPLGLNSASVLLQ